MGELLKMKATAAKTEKLVENCLIARLHEDDTKAGVVEWIVRWLQARGFLLTWDKDGLLVFAPESGEPLTEHQNQVLMDLWPEVLTVVKTRVVN
jgi:hypothetical protein